MGINKYMPPAEACFRWGIKITALHWHLSNDEKMQEYIAKGWAKYFLKPGGKRKEWTISNRMMEDLFGAETNGDFIDFEISEVAKDKNTTNVVNEEEVREKAQEDMWYQIARRNIFEGYVEIKKSRLKECIEYNRQSKDFFNYCWEHLEHASKERGYKVPRISYLLNAFLYDGKRIKMDDTYAGVEEQILFAVIEYIRLQKVNKADTTVNN